MRTQSLAIEPRWAFFCYGVLDNFFQNTFYERICGNKLLSYYV